MQPVSASMSSGSIAGNMAIRSWLRPSLRYDSVSTMPFARRMAATACGVDAVVEIDGADHGGTLIWVRDEWRGVRHFSAQV